MEEVRMHSFMHSCNRNQDFYSVKLNQYNPKPQHSRVKDICISIKYDHIPNIYIRFSAEKKLRKERN